MATIREGDKTALLVVDMQVGVVEGAWQDALIIINVRRAVEKARAEGIPVIWIQHTNREMPPGSPAWQIVPGLSRSRMKSESINISTPHSKKRPWRKPWPNSESPTSSWQAG